MRSIAQLLWRFRSDEQGTIAMIFGLISIMLLAFGGVSIDMSRTYGASSRADAALDAAILAAGEARNRLGLSDPELQILANRHFQSNLAGAGARVDEYSNFRLQISNDGQTFTGFVDVSVPMFFTGLVSIDQMNFTATTTATFDQKVVELAMMLDVTGSMRGSKIDGLKLAAGDLIGLLIRDNPRGKSNRIALAPYAASVNLGSLSNRVTGPGNDSLDGCVVGRDGFAATQEDEPGSNTWLTALDPANPLPDIDPTEFLRPDAYSCPDAEVLPLTNSKTELLDRVDDFTADGWTAGHLGAAWGWYLVSPEWSDVFDNGSQPAPYSDDETIKAVLFMTDGNFNTRYIGNVGDKSKDQALDLCTNMKSENVVVYSVAFEAPAPAEATLRACATSAEHYFSAENNAELRAAFRQIASSLTRLRLTQ